ncbi:hypothetical protein [Bradyrhizobium sp. McL0616]|uniref:hypothetical protein n=1 Tax=Bradyrhizobium sp. McL0616 TaxID=3415674 RepID=UPI003CF53DE2
MHTIRMVRVATSALCNRLGPSWALRQAEEKFSQCSCVGSASGLLPISTVVFSAFITASTIGSSELNDATPISARLNVLLQRSPIMSIARRR